ncbi:MAG: polyprenyl synthetase family protein [Candidatus Cloacimonadales bacterium]
MLLQKYFVVRQKLVSEALSEYFVTTEKNEQYLNEAIRYSLLAEGKRLRPILLFAVYEMLRGRKSIKSLERIMPVAVALEMVHTASLVHDDLPSLDNARMRRGQLSNHEKYNPATAILVGDALITKAFEVLTDLKNKDKALKCVNILAKAISTSGMIGGQTVDLESANKNIKINVLKYIHIKKTGALLQAATDMGCALCDADENVMITLGNYALNLGLAYQIIDDILDDMGASDILGKEPEDRENNKTNYATLLGVEVAKKNAEKLLSDSYKMIKNFNNNEILVELIGIIKERLP